MQLQQHVHVIRNFTHINYIRKFIRTFETISRHFSETGVAVHLHPELELIQTPGIEVQEVKTASIVRKPQNGKLVLQKYQFMPYHCLHVGLFYILPVHSTLNGIEKTEMFFVMIVNDYFTYFYRRRP